MVSGTVYAHFRAKTKGPAVQKAKTSLLAAKNNSSSKSFQAPYNIYFTSHVTS